jgi:endoglucanase
LAFCVGCMLLQPAAALAQLPTPTYGWNLGNTLEAPGGVGTWDPAPTRALIEAVAAAGFNTIRIPCAWGCHANPSTGRIDPAYLAEVERVVGWCYAANLHVIIDDHWDGGWFEDCGFDRFSPAINGRIESYWTQIATAFAKDDDRLLFACANEPSIGRAPAKGAAQTAVLLRYYRTFVHAVRAAGGNNVSRWLVLQGPDTNIDKTCRWMTSLPADPTPGRLMVEVHYYEPYRYTLMPADQPWGKMLYFWGRGYHSQAMPDRDPAPGEETRMQDAFRKMHARFVARGIPVLLGEFGAIRRTGFPGLTGAELSRHLASRTFFDKTVIDDCARYGLKPVYWDDGNTGAGGFGLFSRTTGALVDAESARALTGGPAAPAPRY